MLIKEEKQILRKSLKLIRSKLDSSFIESRALAITNKFFNIVDINNLISLHTCYSVGTYDLDKVKGSITFTVGEENERYEGIGRGSINLENLPVFEDEDGKFGSTTSDSIKAMITNDTT
ncbi:phenylalanine--tRNA ligase beta subunit-related protein, partial [Brachyspira pilosicoli]